MINAKTKRTRQILAGLHMTGLDKLYQQFENELGIIVTLHHVAPPETKAFDPNALLTVTPDFLDAAIGLLKARGFDIVDLDEASRRIVEPKRGRRFAVLTFDDGYRDNLVHAKPVLNGHEVPYTIFIAPNLVDGSACIWWEAIDQVVASRDNLMVQMDGRNELLDCSTTEAKYRSYDILLDWLTKRVDEADVQARICELCTLNKMDAAQLTRDQIMSWDELHEIEADPKCTLGAHTMNHAAVARLKPESALAEMVQSATVLEAHFGKRPRHFAYPYGYREAAAGRDFELAREAGFTTAVTTRPGLLYPQHNDHMTALPRVSANGLFQKMRYFGPLTTGLPTLLNRRGRRLDVA
ncbi:polysaccharide deacetylase family protein [Ahrensia sp. R2A130]|uniref:polysaccharide deacetylase family protein n=1 Tax=Ahrensia sp. R2A130 TaxID=744979 RepID=UPI0001E083A9|nr:polysaccharide deacetylase family protein [Ahrensia sp. R2A130]EFL90509.1 polysaccharide deacetylase [Ahrensia sp. R2A130]